MSIKSELENTRKHLRASREAILGRGGEISLTAGLKDFPEAIFNIPADTSLVFYEDSEVAYQKQVPANVNPYALIKEIGGMTKKPKNLWNNEIAKGSSSKIIQTTTGFEFTRNSSTGGVYWMINIPIYAGRTVIFSASHTVSGGSVRLYLYSNKIYGDVLVNVSASADLVYTATENIPNAIFAVIADSATQSCVVSNIQVEIDSGTGAHTDYEAYFEGLRSAPVTEMVSEGKNLCSGVKAGAYINSSGVYNKNVSGYQCTEKMQIDPSKAYVYSTLEGSLCENVHFWDTDGVWLGAKYRDLTVPANARYMALNFTTTATVTVQVEMGTESTEYVPCKEPNRFAIPESVQALDGYGEGINGSVYNYVELVEKKFYKRVGCVDMGTLKWTYVEAEKLFWAHVTGMKQNSTVLCVPYTFFPSATAFRQNNKAISTYVSFGTDVVNVRDSSYTDTETFKAALSGVMLYYELSAPKVTDISDLLPEDNFIKVEGGGTITAVNEYEYSVPTTIKYVQKVGG